MTFSLDFLIQEQQAGLQRCWYLNMTPDPRTGEICVYAQAAGPAHLDLCGVDTHSAIPCSIFRSIPPSARAPSSVKEGFAMELIER